MFEEEGEIVIKEIDFLFIEYFTFIKVCGKQKVT